MCDWRGSSPPNTSQWTPRHIYFSAARVCSTCKHHVSTHTSHPRRSSGLDLRALHIPYINLSIYTCISDSPSHSRRSSGLDLRALYINLLHNHNNIYVLCLTCEYPPVSP